MKKLWMMILIVSLFFVFNDSTSALPMFVVDTFTTTQQTSKIGTGAFTDSISTNGTAVGSLRDITIDILESQVPLPLGVGVNVGGSHFLTISGPPGVKAKVGVSWYDQEILSDKVFSTPLNLNFGNAFALDVLSNDVSNNIGVRACDLDSCFESNTNLFLILYTGTPTTLEINFNTFTGIDFSNVTQLSAIVTFGTNLGTDTVISAVSINAVPEPSSASYFILVGMLLVGAFLLDNRRTKHYSDYLLRKK